jgi:hypothetical protein
LTRARLVHVNQYYLRADTIAAANALLIAAQSEVPIVRPWHAGIGGRGRTRGSARNCSIDIGGRRRRNFLACGSHNTAWRTVGTHWHPGTAQ